MTRKLIKYVLWLRTREHISASVQGRKPRDWMYMVWIKAFNLLDAGLVHECENELVEDMRRSDFLK